MGRVKKSADAVKGHISKAEREARERSAEHTRVQTDGLSSPPTFLKGEARREFLRVVTETRKAGLLDNLDISVLAVYAEAYAHYVELAELIAKTGAVIVKRRVTGKVEIQPNPAVTAQQLYADRIFKCSTKLGLAVTDRMKLTTPKPEKPLNKFLQFIQQVE